MMEVDAIADARILSFLPEGGMTFRGVVLRYREDDFAEDLGGDILLDTKEKTEGIVHESLKRLEKAGQVVVQNFPNWPLMYARKVEHGPNTARATQTGASTRQDSQETP